MDTGRWTSRGAVAEQMIHLRRQLIDAAQSVPTVVNQGVASARESVQQGRQRLAEIRQNANDAGGDEGQAGIWKSRLFDTVTATAVVDWFFMTST